MSRRRGLGPSRQVRASGASPAAAPPRTAAARLETTERTAPIDAPADRPTEAAVRPPLRRPVAVIVSRFPKITETFILREIEALERQGQPVRLVPLLRQRDAVVHADAVPWIARALYTPFVDRAILRENLAAFVESPRRYLRVLGRVLAGSLRSPNAFLGTLGIFPKSVYLGRVLARDGVGHLHGHFATHPAMAAYVASEFGGIPWSFTAHAHDVFLPGSRAMLGEKLRRSAFVRVISDYNRRFLEERYPGAADGRIRVIHMGIDPERYGPGSPEPGRILCVASLRPYKGIPTLVEACAREPLRRREFQLAIVGDGPQRKALEDRIVELGLTDRIRLLGARPQEEVTRLLASAQIFVHPSTVARRGWMDGIPVALMEAMATHLPVVTTWVSGIPELVGDEREGVLVFPDDPGALAEALAGLLDNPERARAMGELGSRKVAEAFHLERCAAELIGELDRHSLPVPDEVAGVLGPGIGRARDPDGSAAAGLHRWHLGKDAVVAELHVDEGPRSDIVVKAHRELPGAPRTAGERARVEFEVLRKLDGEGAPGVVTLLEAGATVVMERVPGVALDALVTDGIDDARVTRALEAAGLWLHRFQERTEGEGGVRPDEALDALLQRAEADLARCGARLPARLADTLRTTLAGFRSARLPHAIRTVGHHCDFWPGNILFDGSEVTVIDFEGYRPGLPHEDAAWFLVHLELVLARPWGGEAARGAAAGAFLEGTGLTGPEDQPFLALAIAAASLHLLAREPAGAGPFGLGGWLRAPGAWWRRRLLRRILDRSAERAAGTLRPTPPGPGP